jgi:hypothetical protein
MPAFERIIYENLRVGASFIAARTHPDKILDSSNSLLRMCSAHLRRKWFENFSKHYDSLTKRLILLMLLHRMANTEFDLMLLFTPNTGFARPDHHDLRALPSTSRNLPIYASAPAECAQQITVSYYHEDGERN